MQLVVVKAVMKAVARLDGSFALGVLCADCPGELIAVKSASPLILGVGVGENFFASDVTALVSHTRNVIYLEDGVTCLPKVGLDLRRSTATSNTLPLITLTSLACDVSPFW